jgi:hypothetical protein
MKDDVKKDTTAIYDKIQKDTVNSLKKYNEGINALEAKSRRFWAIEGIKEALFWCMCFAMILFIGKEILILWGHEEIVELWKIIYIFYFAPILKYGFVKLIEKK